MFTFFDKVNLYNSKIIDSGVLIRTKLACRPYLFHLCLIQNRLFLNEPHYKTAVLKTYKTKQTGNRRNDRKGGKEDLHLTIIHCILLLLTFCLLLLPLWESVIVLCFVVRYFMSILVLQSS